MSSSGVSEAFMISSSHTVALVLDTDLQGNTAKMIPKVTPWLLGNELMVEGHLEKL